MYISSFTRMENQPFVVVVAHCEHRRCLVATTVYLFMLFKYSCVSASVSTFDFDEIQLTFLRRKIQIFMIKSAFKNSSSFIYSFIHSFLSRNIPICDAIFYCIETIRAKRNKKKPTRSRYETLDEEVILSVIVRKLLRALYRLCKQTRKKTTRQC